MDLYEDALGDYDGSRAVELQARELAERGYHELALELTRRAFAVGNSEAFTGWRGVTWSPTANAPSKSWATL